MNDLVLSSEVFKKLIFFIPLLLIFGKILKLTPYISNWMIVWIILFTGMVFGILTYGNNVEGLVYGLLSSTLAITIHQTYKQTLIGIDEIKYGKK